MLSFPESNTSEKEDSDVGKEEGEENPELERVLATGKLTSFKTIWLISRPSDSYMYM